MNPFDWVAMISDRAERRLCHACLDIWRDEVMPKFEQRYGVSISGLP
jgi:hypothetical protein